MEIILSFVVTILSPYVLLLLLTTFGQLPLICE